MKSVPKTSTYSLSISISSDLPTFFKFYISICVQAYSIVTKIDRNQLKYSKLKGRIRKNKNVRFSFDILRGDTINRVELHSKLLPCTACKSRYIQNFMIRSAHITTKVHGLSAVDNLGLLHQQARGSCSSLQYYLALATNDLCL